MSVPLKSLEVGKCYLMETGHVRRVVRIMPDGRIQYEHRVGHVVPRIWKAGIQDGRSFAVTIEREVPWDWTPEADEALR